MGKRFEVSDMPALTPEMQKRIGILENQLQAALTPHCNGYNLFDLEGAYEKVRTFATVFYGCYYNFYSQYPAYKAHWRKASEVFAYQRVLTWINNFYATRENFDPSRLKRIMRTISDYADGTARAALSPPPGKQASDYAASGVDIASGSPLLKMAVAVGHAPALNSRKALRDAYRAAFPDVKIADIIWAAKQTRREWTRWINGQAKDGLRPDRSFRHVLTSGKTPEQIMGKPRPTKYTT